MRYRKELNRASKIAWIFVAVTSVFELLDKLDAFVPLNKKVKTPE